MDTTVRECKVCGAEFDSILEFDNGICDECREKIEPDEDVRGASQNGER